MRAAWYQDFGTASEVIQTGQQEAPVPGDGEVLVKVACSGINPVDVKRRAGGRGVMTDDRVIPHFDGAGVIEETGQRVWLYESQWQSASGTAAEYVTVPAHLAVPLPDGTSFEEGACLGIPALTAHRCVYGDGSVEGKTVLVTGGAGAVGNYAIQFAKLGGASVITTVSSDEKAKLAAEAGADHIVNYHAENVTEAIMGITDNAGVDRIAEVEFGGNLDTSVAILKTNGVIATYASEAAREPQVPFYQLLYKNIVVRHELVFIMPDEAKKQAVADITKWLGAGSVKHHIGQVFPLEQAREAHEAVEGGAYGKVLLRISE